MNTLQRIPAVFFFEWRRALTVPRLAWMVVLMAFPPLLLYAANSMARRDPPVEIAAILIFVLSPCVACMMSVFLWATPVLSAELEGRSWVYLAVRPYGPVAVLIGKYLVAISWALPVGLVSASVAANIIGSDSVARLVWVECGLATLSCLAYAAVFLLIGVLIPNRAMVAGIVYAVVFEAAAASIPAALNLFTIQYRLRCILVRWMEFDVGSARGKPVFVAYFGDESAAWHVAVLLGMTVCYLVAAALLLRYREFTSAAETEA